MSRTKERKQRGAHHFGEALDPRIVKAIAHPLRHQALVVLHEREASPKELAEELGEPIGKVAHHVRTLVGLGAIELVREERRRGAIEHYYRATMRPFFDDREWALLPVGTRRALFDQYIRHIFDDVARAAAAGGFDHPQAHVTRSPLELDDEAFQELSELLLHVVERAAELHAESAGRLAEGASGGERIATELAILHFERRRRTATDA